MKLFATATIIMGLWGANALAQPDLTDPSTNVSLPAPDPIDQMSVDECRTHLRECLDKVASQGEEGTARLTELAERMGFSSADEMLANDCRSRRGTWSNGECLCASPNSWYTAETQTCCVENTRAYERRQDSCRESGGSYTCRGGCRCPWGTQLLDGRCMGDAATRDEIERLRARVPELESEVARLQGELNAAHAQSESQADRIADLESQLAAARGELDSLRDQLARLNDYIRSQGGTPPLTPPGPLPGTDEAVAAAVGPSTPNPVTDTVPPSDGETDENWCEANPGWCTLVILGSAVAATGLGFGICAAAGCFDEEPHNMMYY